MVNSRKPRTPKYRHHRGTGQGFVEIDGRYHYLGKWGLPATENAYHRLVAEWISGGYRLPVNTKEITVLEVADAYVEHAKVYYHDNRTGKPSSACNEVRTALEDVLRLYGDIPAVAFGPNALRAVRVAWLERKISITTLNKYAAAIRRMFKWAAAHEMVPVDTYQALGTLAGLRRGRGVGKDPVKRQPAVQADVDAVLKHLNRHFAAIVKILLYTGARPSEVLNMKRADLDTKGDVWVAVVREHKTASLGKQRRLFFGPRAQAALRPFLLRMDGEYLFSPKEAEAERHAREKEKNDSKGRRENQKPNPRKTDRTLRDHYDCPTLNRAIRRVCKANGIPVWTPYQLRHLAATTIEATSDLETASAILGHSGLDITQVYVHRDSKAAAAWAAVHG